jgi:hypothetical protein
MMSPIKITRVRIAPPHPEADKTPENDNRAPSQTLIIEPIAENFKIKALRYAKSSGYSA